MNFKLVYQQQLTMSQSNNNHNNTPSSSTISCKDRMKISKAYKKCLDTLAKKYKYTINQLEDIVNENKTKTSVTSNVKANSHLVNLMDKFVYEWFQRAQRLIETGPITDEMLLQKAHESKQIFGIPNFVTDYEWVWNFRKRYNITKLDMTMLRIENDNRPLSVDINDIVLFVLKNNPITEHFSYTSLQDNTAESTLEMGQRNLNPNQYLLCYSNTNNNGNETIIPDNLTPEVNLEALPVITNDKQAKRHLKPLEDYVLLKEDFRAIGLISQLDEIFATETNIQSKS